MSLAVWFDGWNAAVSAARSRLGVTSGERASASLPVRAVMSGGNVADNLLHVHLPLRMHRSSRQDAQYAVNRVGAGGAMAGHDAMHRTILVVDIEQSSNPIRTNSDQLVIRSAMYQSLAVAFRRSDWLKCRKEDRGDGVLILVPPGVPKIRLVTTLLDRLVRPSTGTTPQWNGKIRRGPPPLRSGCGSRFTPAKSPTTITASSARDHPHIPSGRCTTDTAAFAASPGVCALIVSDWFYSEVVHHHPGARPDRYRQIDCAVKETHLSAWMRVPYQPGAGEEPAEAARQERGSWTALDGDEGPGAAFSGYHAIDVTSPPWPQQSPELGEASGRIACRTLCAAAGPSPAMYGVRGRAPQRTERLLRKPLSSATCRMTRSVTRAARGRSRGWLGAPRASVPCPARTRWRRPGSDGRRAAGLSSPTWPSCPPAGPAAI